MKQADSGELWGSGEVRTDRWLPYGARSGEGPPAFAFTVGQDGAPAAVHRPADSGERTEVGYAWAGYRDGTPAGDTIRLTRRIHLDPRGATPEQVATVRHQLTGALEQLVNQRHHRLPVLQPDQVTGPPAPGPVLWVGAEFVDSPEAAHTVVRVHPGLPAPGQPMVQNRWFTGVHAAAHAHEFVHGLGVRDDRADPRVLLTPGGRGSQTVTEGQSSLMGPLRDDAGTEPCFTLTSDHLQQITDVLAPYLHQGNHTPTAAGGGQLSANSARVGSDTSPAVDYELIHADDKSSVVESGEGEALYHFTDALPERIFREGLAPMDRSTIVTVERWQANPPSQFVSTTRNETLWSHKKLYRYDIDPVRSFDPVDRTGVDVNATITKQEKRPRLFEEEVAFTGRIPPQAIVRVHYYGPNTNPPNYKKILKSGTWDATAQKVVWNQDTAPSLPAGWGKLSEAATPRSASSAPRASVAADSAVRLPSVAAMRLPREPAPHPSDLACTSPAGRHRAEPKSTTLSRLSYTR
ncbi:hypothetical protein [Streptomyces sp. NBC_00872]|uniref:scabin-related ADP-ribosyltransferase n=1 Tax=Streptomyces sp. NBC_00872 TaxID=2903686 RepID=UPI00386D9DE0|nr:hypothetical protein OG214_12705 [Streptomyces sp. NBC_00872]